MLVKLFYVAWLLAIILQQIECQNRPGASGAGATGGGAAGAGAGAAGGGAAGAGAAGGGAAGGGFSGGGAAGGGAAGAGGFGTGGFGSGGAGTGGAGANMQFSMNAMNGMQLPFPFFICDINCQPFVFQQQQQQQIQPVTSPRPMTTTPIPTTRAPMTTTPMIRPTTQSVYTQQMMYPNWCLGWCKFFYQPSPPVYYQPNCILFSWMGMGMGMQRF